MSHLNELLNRLRAEPLGALLERLQQSAQSQVPAGRDGAPQADPVAAAAAGPLGPAFDLLRRAQRSAPQSDAGGGVRAERTSATPSAAALSRLAEAALLGEDIAGPIDEARGGDDREGADEAGRRAPSAPGSARSLLEARERRLRRQESLTARILDQMERGAAVTALPQRAPLQQELRIVCPARGASGGRFLLCNDLGAAARVGFRAQALHAVPGSAAERARLCVIPGELDLACGEERLVRVAIDLAAAPASATELEFVLDAVVGDEVLHKLWVSIAVAAPLDDPGAEASE